VVVEVEISGALSSYIVGFDKRVTYQVSVRISKHRKYPLMAPKSLEGARIKDCEASTVL
jgi:hypothetical protein